MKRTFTAIVCTLLLVAVLAGCGSTNPFDAAAKTFSDEGMTITLTSDFSKQSMDGYTVCYAAKTAAVFALHETNDQFAAAGLNDVTLEQYAALVMQNNSSRNPVAGDDINGCPTILYDRASWRLPRASASAHKRSGSGTNRPAACLLPAGPVFGRMPIWKGGCAMAAATDERLIYEILSAVGEIPEGNVATYGQIARLIGRPKNARLVGRVLSQAERYGDYPCHRVVDHSGRLVPGWDAQAALLAREGVTLRDAQHVDLRRYQWQCE